MSDKTGETFNHGDRWNTRHNEWEMIELDINKRWENGIPHHPKSIELFEAIAKIDFELGGDFFCWKSGGDGDNGEHLMYELDVYFERLDAKNPQPPGDE